MKAIPKETEQIKAILKESPFNDLDKKLFEHIFNLQNLKRIFSTLAIIPSAAPDSVLVDIGCYAPMISLYQKLKDYRNIIAISNYEWNILNKTHEKKENREKLNLKIFKIDVERQMLPISDSSADVVLMLEVLEHFSIDPLFAFSEINRILKPDGFLILSTPNALNANFLWKLIAATNPFNEPYNALDSNRHNRLYSPAEISLLADDCGFQPDFITSINLGCNWKTVISRTILDLIDLIHFRCRKNSFKMRGEIILSRWQKKGSVKKRYPHWLYISRELWNNWYQKMEKINVKKK